MGIRCDLGGGEASFAAAAIEAPLPLRAQQHARSPAWADTRTAAFALFEARREPAGALLTPRPIISDWHARWAARGGRLSSRRAARADRVGRALVVTALRLGDRSGPARYFREYLSSSALSGKIVSARSRSDRGAALRERPPRVGGRRTDRRAPRLAVEADHVPPPSASCAPGPEGRLAGHAREWRRARPRSAPVTPFSPTLRGESAHVENAIPAMRCHRADPRASYPSVRILLMDTLPGRRRPSGWREKVPAPSRLCSRTASRSHRSTSLGGRRLVPQCSRDRAEFAPALASRHDLRQQDFSVRRRLHERALALDNRLCAAHYLPPGSSTGAGVRRAPRRT